MGGSIAGRSTEKQAKEGYFHDRPIYYLIGYSTGLSNITSPPTRRGAVYYRIRCRCAHASFSSPALSQCCFTEQSSLWQPRNGLNLSDPPTKLSNSLNNFKFHRL